MSSTDTVGAARSHARAQVGAAADTQPTVPSSSAVDLPDGVASTDVLWDERLGHGGYAARRLPRGARLRLVAETGDTSLALVVHHAGHTHERLNVADTVKLQWNAYLGEGHLLLSDMGRVLATVLGDDTGLDLLCGAGVRPAGAQFSARDRLVLGLARFDLGSRDLPPPVNLFRPVRVDPDDGRLALAEPCAAGAAVLLRAELPLLVTVAVGAHPLESRDDHVAGSVRLTAWRSEPAGPHDEACSATPEATRAFENTDEWLLGTAP